MTAIVNVDSDGTVHSVNSEFERTAGYSRYEILGKSVGELQYGHRDGPFFRLIAHAVREGRPRSPVRPACMEEIRSDDGFAVVHPLTDVLGNVVGYTAIKRPSGGCAERPDGQGITPQTESVERLAGGIAHNYNNLLTSMIGNAELLLSRMENTDARRRFVEEILGASERAAFLTRMLLDFVRRQPFLPRTLDLNALIEVLGRELEGIAGAGNEVTLQLDPELCPVRTDPRQIEEALGNLVENARDAMPEGGTVTIETANEEFSESSAHRDVRLRPGRYVRIDVSDTGIGMDEETRARAFEPFFSTKEKKAGLGLSAVYGVVKRSGGDIRIFSRPGKGTTVTIFLPQAEQDVGSIPRFRDWPVVTSPREAPPGPSPAAPR